MNIGEDLTNKVTLQIKWFFSKSPNETVDTIKNALFIGDSTNKKSKMQIGDDAFQYDELMYIYVLGTSKLSGYFDQSVLIRSKEQVQKSKIRLNDINIVGDAIVGSTIDVEFVVVSDSVFYNSNTSILQ